MVTLDQLNTVFSPYGYVKKMVTFSKPDGGVVAWVQFSDATTAASVKAALQNQPLPRHLAGEHASPPVMEMAFFWQPDLAVRTQSYCTR